MGGDQDMQPDPSSTEAIGAFVAMMVVLLFFLIYFCCVPIYHGYKKRKEREDELLNTVSIGFSSQGRAKLRAKERECSKECACIIREMGKQE